MSLILKGDLQYSYIKHKGNKPLFAAGSLLPFLSKKDNLKWFYSRPQASDVITHSQDYKTDVTSLIDGGQIFENIDKLLSNAKDSVLVDLYELQDPVINSNRSAPAGTPGSDNQQKITEHLINLTKKGVTVKVVIDNSYDSGTKDYHNQKIIDHLRANGVEVVTYPRQGAKISHVKLLVVDGKWAVIGGMNWGNHSPVNHDACVILEGDDVGNIAEQIFKTDYQFAGGDVSTLPKFKTITEEKIKVLTTTPSTKQNKGNGSSEILDEIIDRIKNSQESIITELFTITDKDIADELIQAHQRMKKNKQAGVKILVDPGLYLRFPNCRPAINYLVSKGVPIKFYKVDWQKEEKLHAKWAVFDEKELIIGSANWSKAGLRIKNNPGISGYNSPLQFLKGNHEANLLIESPQLCKAFIKQFFYDWYKKSIPIKTHKELIQTIPDEARSKLFSYNNGAEPLKLDNNNPFEKSLDNMPMFQYNNKDLGENNK